MGLTSPFIQCTPTPACIRRIGGFEPERGSAVAGHRGYFLKDAGLLLNQVRSSNERKRADNPQGHRLAGRLTATTVHPPPPPPLLQALINYGIAFLRKREYSVLQPPYFMNRDVMAGVAQLEQFDEELYKVCGCCVGGGCLVG